MADRSRPLRCAIYTRKSSEEGLEQDFNSLHAQREACEAYVTSQRHEGWRTLPGAYDDGGFSGGSMERPGLRRLLNDVAAGQIDIVVVYKVDRLTRSLTDFAKIVEVFDARGVSFVSVTQAFNTTSSMGRLTLNVLLSFAQFEREVTGERIRDKIAASKKKGLWMGGFVPFGYEAAGRTLARKEPQASIIEGLFRRYADLHSVDALRQELRQDPGFHYQVFSRGHLYRILSNPIYVGQIRHKEQVYAAQHEGIVPQALWDEVQAVLSGNRREHLIRGRAKNPSLLAGLLRDVDGDLLIATHATKAGRRYRYYASVRSSEAPGGGGGREPRSQSWRLPASEIEAAVLTVLSTALGDPEWLAAQIPTGSVGHRQLVLDSFAERSRMLASQDAPAVRSAVLDLVDHIVLARNSLTVHLKGAPDENGEALPPLAITRVWALRRRGPQLRLVLEGVGPPQAVPDPALIRALAQAHRWWRDLVDGSYPTLREIALAYGTDERYAAAVLRLAFLPARDTSAILRGVQPPEFTLHAFLKGMAIDWPGQGVARASL